jgi:Baseplate J-like protein
MSSPGTSDSNCGCCSGTSVQTPAPRSNLPGLSSISYRVGTWASFKESMLARLSSSDYPALAALKTREDDDFTVALLDATAMVLDVMTFYQERLANESYLRTATQSRSLTELSRLIGYQPSPGLSASTYVAFSLRAAPGQPPDPSAPAITIPEGTQLQSVPTQGQTAQTFETAADIQAKADWSAMPVQTTYSWQPQIGDTAVYLQGIATQLQPGDLILIVGDERLQFTASDEWDIRVVTTVTPDAVNGRTYIAWSEGLGAATEQVKPAQKNPRFYAFRQRASLFGYNALSPLMLASTTITALNNAPGPIAASPDPPVPSSNTAGSGYQVGDLIMVTGGGGSGGVLQVQTVSNIGAVTGTLAVSQPGNGYSTTSAAATIGGRGTGLQVGITASPLLNSTKSDWNFAGPGTSLVDLDAIYSKLVSGGWLALNMPGEETSRSPAGLLSLYQIKSATAISRAGYGVSAKISRLLTDSDANLSNYYVATRQTSVLAQSEELAVADQPLDHPLYGTLLDLADLRPDIIATTVIALSGARQKISVNTGVTGLAFVPDAYGSTPVPLNPGDIFTLTDPAPLPLNPDGSVPSWTVSTASITPKVEDASGRTGTLQGMGDTPLSLSQFSLAPSSSTDPVVSEYAFVSSIGVSPTPYPHTQFQLQSNLANCYDRTATTVNANVGLASNGQSVSEIIGSGRAATVDQSFTLKQGPLTYVQAPTQTGRQSTLQVLANGAAWTEVPSLYGAGSSQQVFALLNQSDGTTDVLFGDGVEGATLPTGQNNLQANYRIGLGSSGNVPASSLTTLIDRPVGVYSVTNPEAATGGQDPQSIDDIRSNAPLTVLTLGRAVSLADYQYCANTFAGIAKAYAVWIPSGPGQGVFLTVAGVDGAALPAGNPTLSNLLASLQNYGNPLIPITIQSFIETLFGLSADLRYDPAYQQATVLAQVLQTLSTAYGFAERTFGQGVSLDEISTVIQSVPGVIAVNVKGIIPGLSSTAGDLAGLSNGFSLSTWNSWVAQQISVPRPYTNSANIIPAYVPVANTQSLPLPAEILVLDPRPGAVVLGVMP